jgi:ribonuclease Z
MTPFRVRILGSNSSQASFGRFLPSHLLTVDNKSYLIDCGEGTQFQMTKYKIKRNRIQAVFISHLHGDHLFGLPGFLSSFHHFNRYEALRIFGPPGIKQFINVCLDASFAHLGYSLYIHEITENDVPSLIFEDNKIEVFAFPLKHRVPTIGFRFNEKVPKLNIKPDAIERYRLSVDQVKELKSGRNVILSDGNVLTIQEACFEKAIARSYAYVSDTVYDESIVEHIKEVDLLFHETTYIHDLVNDARDRMHSTTKEAAEIAKKAKVKKLIIGHYSSRYADITPFESECKEIFPDSHMGVDGYVFDIIK